MKFELFHLLCLEVIVCIGAIILFTVFPLVALICFAIAGKWEGFIFTFFLFLTTSVTILPCIITKFTGRE